MRTDQQGIEAKKYFNLTYIDTAKISVDFAKPQGDSTLGKSWSKYS
eukprot:CAMPEP_0170562842 /NCGR_PEP_ID=MMETSP0211-20121228/62743_1 /TAXON_ID=311385 /ORGANISM="Pseudokeronopsis sp., Strain OXSARD2" /LENGTH=45 /DNA_ID= /DNA_START= /DNA_END= /DNA_ORIENTATION=